MDTGMPDVNYTDLKPLTELRREAQTNAPQALEKVAQQFEALFLQMMMKSMRDASGSEGGLFDNDQTRLYQDMYDKQISLSMSKSDNGIGLDKLLVQQLQKTMPQTAEQQSEPVKKVSYSYTLPQRRHDAFALQPRPQATAAPRVNSLESDRFETPKQFVTTLLPHARRIGRELGVDPRAILAQAALETGWGKFILRRGDGSSSFNVFNIKAGQDWQGERVGRRTLEYQQGATVMEHANFRSYGSLEACFDDYAAFLKESGRYQEALEAGSDGHRFAEQLQKAGYATDPGYAKKIQSILSNEWLALMDEGLNLFADETLT